MPFHRRTKSLQRILRPQIDVHRPRIMTKLDREITALLRAGKVKGLGREEIRNILKKAAAEGKEIAPAAQETGAPKPSAA